ncbi:MAG: hypothetical protein HN341_06700 [Verrucomicrobia bacterium]|jgi:hypothetical protein|nr:hypothetical protein [Verrucomicrobiota bacterium]
MENNTICLDSEDRAGARCPRWRERVGRGLAVLALLRVCTYAICALCGEFACETPLGVLGIRSFDSAFWQSVLLLLGAAFLLPKAPEDGDTGSADANALSIPFLAAGLIFLLAGIVWLRGIYFSYFKVLSGAVESPTFSMWHVHATIAAALLASACFWVRYRHTLDEAPRLLGTILLIGCPLWSGIGIGSIGSLLLAAALWSSEVLLARSKKAPDTSTASWVTVAVCGVAVLVLLLMRRGEFPSTSVIIHHIAPGFCHVIAVMGLVAILLRRDPILIRTGMLLLLLFAACCYIRIELALHLSALIVPLAVVGITQGMNAVWTRCTSRGSVSLCNAVLLLMLGLIVEAFSYGLDAFPFSVLWSGR